MSNKRGYDDESTDSSCPDSPTMYPLLLSDVDGRKKFIFSDEEAKDFRQRVERSQLDEASLKIRLPLEPSLDIVMKKEHDTVPTKKRAGHGLAPNGMNVPKKGEAYLVGRIKGVKETLKESNLEKYRRIGEERDERKRKEDKKTVKRLKKEGKVCTLAPYMYK